MLPPIHAPHFKADAPLALHPVRCLAVDYLRHICPITTPCKKLAADHTILTDTQNVGAASEVRDSGSAHNLASSPLRQDVSFGAYLSE